LTCHSKGLVLNMTVEIVRDALLTVSDKVYHYKPDPNIKTGYIVWGETGTDNIFEADDEIDTITIGGELYYYTKVEYDPTFDQICEALDEHDISWALINIGYDKDLEQIVYAMKWGGVVCGKGNVYKQ